MSVVLFLFARKVSNALRWAFLITGYDTRKKDLAERLYGVYVGVIVVGWGIVMLSWSVTTLVVPLERLHIAPADIAQALGLLLAFWLALTPWMAWRAPNLYRFGPADLDFLSTSPLRVPLVALSWFFKSLANRFNAAVVLGCGVLASALSEVAKQNDLLGLAEGLAAGALFVVIVNGVLWALALLRYRPVPASAEWQGVLLSAVSVAAVFVVIVNGARWILELLSRAPTPALGDRRGALLSAATLAAPVFVPLREILLFPASLSASLLAQASGAGDGPTLSLLALLATATVAVGFVVLASSRTRLVMPFEEAALGRRVRGLRQAPPAPEPLPRPVLVPRHSRVGRIPVHTTAQANASPAGALFSKEMLRLERMPPLQRVQFTAGPLVIGAVAALALIYTTQGGLRIEVLAPICFFANFALIRVAMSTLRVDLAHADLYASWPLSRSRLMLLDIAWGCALPLVGGEAAILAAGLSVAGGEAAALWSVLWPLLVAASGAVALVDMARQARSWAGAADTVPEVGPLVLALAGVIWLVALFFGPGAAVAICAVVLLAATALVRFRAVG